MSAPASSSTTTTTTPPKEYVYFWETSSVFSQWHRAHFTDIKGVKYSSAEQYMMAEKARLFGDAASEKAIMKTNDVRKIKELGRTVEQFDEAKWVEKRRDIALAGNYLKFSQNEKMKAELLETGDAELVEASPYDKIWGIGLTAAKAKEIDPSQWPGENLLGKALMQVRVMLQPEMCFTPDVEEQIVEAGCKVIDRGTIGYIAESTVAPGVKKVKTTAADLGPFDDPDYEDLRLKHGTMTTAECPEHECMICSMIACPDGCSMHFDKDGCPNCDAPKKD